MINELPPFIVEPELTFRLRRHLKHVRQINAELEEMTERLSADIHTIPKRERAAATIWEVNPLQALGATMPHHDAADVRDALPALYELRMALPTARVLLKAIMEHVVRLDDYHRHLIDGPSADQQEE